ncbi:MAG TPA: nodulation protein NfeD [Steroidobacteraceae bacterium]|nr:nodulation protein NfeD [Steroidobacteraceae bacterium]
MLPSHRCAVPLAALAAALFAVPALAQGAAPGPAVLVEIKDAIGPATKDHFLHALEHAHEVNAVVLVLQLDTPGGLDAAMRDMIQGILASEVPVVTYVGPSGARAASAGTFILYASHVAAMAPGTNLGAATPVPIGGSPPADDRGKGREDGGAEDDGEEVKKPAPAGTTSDRKAVNDAIAYIRSLADLRDRDPEFAEAAVREAASLPAQQALERGVIDLIAPDVPGLLAALDGREVKLPRETRKLATTGAVVERIEMNWRTSLLAVLTNPLVAYGLLIIGLYGLMFEGYNPGAILPGVIGAICLLLGLYALQVLSVNFAGLALVVLGVGMMIAEFFVPSFGALGFGGLVAFVIGSVVLMDMDTPGFESSRGLVGGIATFAGAAMLGTMYLAMRARRRPVVTGAEQLTGDFAEVVEDFEGRGNVRIYGELWNAVSTRPVARGQRVRVDRVDGLTLHVSPDQ